MATTKISELNPLLSGSTCANAVLPVVNDGTTDKISIDNLRGTLRGASNQGPANAALNGGINNAACRLGDGVLGGQANTVNANFAARTSNSGCYCYDGPVVISQGSLSSIIGGLRNEISIATASLCMAYGGYPLLPSLILNSVGTCISESANSPYDGYYPIVGGSMIMGAHGTKILGPTANGNYNIGLNSVIGGYCNTLDFTNQVADQASANYMNSIINSVRSNIIGISSGSSEGSWMAYNTLVGSYDSDIINGYENSDGYYNLIGNSQQAKILDSGQSTILGTDLSTCIENSSHATIIGARCACVSSSLRSTVIGGEFGRIIEVNRAVVLGGSNVTASVDNAVHLNQLVFRTGPYGIPTSDPGIAGQVWNDNGTLKIS